MLKNDIVTNVEELSRFPVKNGLVNKGVIGM